MAVPIHHGLWGRQRAVPQRRLFLRKQHQNQRHQHVLWAVEVVERSVDSDEMLEGMTEYLKEYKFNAGEIIITHRSNGTLDTFDHQDNQGSTILTTDESGTVVSEAIYDPCVNSNRKVIHSITENPST